MTFCASCMNGDGVDDTGTPDNLLRGEDPDDDEDSIAEHRNNEGDDEEAADNTTALGFMKLLEVDVNTPEDCLGALVDSKFSEGPKGVSTLAAAAAASSILTPSSFIHGFANVTSSFSASFSSGDASLASWNIVFKMIVEQAKLERKLQATIRAKKIEAIRKASKAALRMAKTCVSIIYKLERQSRLILIWNGSLDFLAISERPS